MCSRNHLLRAMYQRNSRKNDRLTEAETRADGAAARHKRIGFHYSTESGKEKRRKQRNFDRFLGKLPVGNSPYSNIKAAETPAVGKIAEKIRNSPKFHKKSNRPASPHKNVQQSEAVVYVPLRGVTSFMLATKSRYSREELSYVPLRGVIFLLHFVFKDSRLISPSPCGV